MSGKDIVLVVSVSIIKENKPKAWNKWNFPGGRVEYGEELLDSAWREAKEETGFDVKLTGTTGIYNFTSSTNNQIILFHFIGKIIGGALSLEEDIISASKWIKMEGFVQFDSGQLREPVVLKQIIARLIQKEFYPVEVFAKSSATP